MVTPGRTPTLTSFVAKLGRGWRRRQNPSHWRYQERDARYGSTSLPEWRGQSLGPPRGCLLRYHSSRTPPIEVAANRRPMDIGNDGFSVMQCAAAATAVAQRLVRLDCALGNDPEASRSPSAPIRDPCTAASQAVRLNSRACTQSFNSDTTRRARSAETPSAMLQPVSRASAPTLAPQKQAARRAGQLLGRVLDEKPGVDARLRLAWTTHPSLRQRPRIMAPRLLGTSSAMTT
jgi:hypothetical protein